LNILGLNWKKEADLPLGNINSLPAKSCYGGEKKSVLLAKHKDTSIPTMIEPFSSSAAWF